MYLNYVKVLVWLENRHSWRETLSSKFQVLDNGVCVCVCVCVCVSSIQNKKQTFNVSTTGFFQEVTVINL